MAKRVLALVVALLLIVLLIHYPMIRFIIGVSSHLDSSYKGYIEINKNMSVTHEFKGQFHRGDIELFDVEILSIECVIDDPLLVAIPVFNDAYVAFDVESSYEVDYFKIYQYLNEHLELEDVFVLKLDKKDLENLYGKAIDHFLWEDFSHGALHIDKNFERFIFELQLDEKLLTGEYTMTHDMMIKERNIIDLEDVKEDILRFIEDVKDIYER